MFPWILRQKKALVGAHEATGVTLQLHTIGHKIPQHIFPATSYCSLLFLIPPYSHSVSHTHNVKEKVVVMTEIIDSICMTLFTEVH